MKRVPVVLSAQFAADQREREAREIGAASGAADDDVRPIVGQLELLDHLLANHRLVHEHVIQDAAQCVAALRILGRQLHRLRDGDAQGARGIGVLLQDRTPRDGLRAGAGEHLGSEHLHHGLAIGLLVEAHAHHEDLAIDAEEVAGHGQRRAPLAGARLGGDALDALRLVVVSLGDGRIGLVRAGGAPALVVVVDARRRIERLLETAGAVQRRRPPQTVDVDDLAGDVDLPLGGDLLLDQSHGEQRRQVFGADGLLGARVQHGRHGLREIGLDVVPGGRDVLLVQ